MAHVLIEGQPGVGETIQLDKAASHHLLRVRRMPRGTALVVVDGRGHEAPAELVAVRDGYAALVVKGPWVGRRPAEPRHLLWAIPKGPALDQGLRMAVEAGVTDIHLALGARSVARSDRNERWRRIVDGACTQSGRPERPRLGPLRPDLVAAVSGIPADAAR
ncbi:MAG: RsmE family RNA methyltransferase, partial [Myxococcota bacterium]